MVNSNVHSDKIRALRWHSANRFLYKLKSGLQEDGSWLDRWDSWDILCECGFFFALTKNDERYCPKCDPEKTTTTPKTCLDDCSICWPKSRCPVCSCERMLEGQSICTMCFEKISAKQKIKPKSQDPKLKSKVGERRVSFK